MDLLHFAHCPYLGADSTVVHTLCISIYRHLCDWISKGSQDKDISCYRTLKRSQDTDICVLMDIGQITRRSTGQITGQNTGQIVGYSG